MHVNFCGLFHTKAILVKQLWYYLSHNWRDKHVHTFPKGIRLKVNVIVQLEFELTYCDVAVQHVSHYTIGIPPPYMH